MQRRRLSFLAAASLAAATLAAAVPTRADSPFAEWTPLGPDLIHNGQATSGSVEATGRLSVVAVNPLNPLGDIWIGAATGGVWRGAIYPSPSWEPMTDDAPTLAVGAIALDGCSFERCNTVWVGTGENAIRRDTQYGKGVLKGSYNPATHEYDWLLLGEEHFSGGNIARLLLDPTTPDGPGKVLYVALSSGVTSNAAHSTVTTTPKSPYGIWKSVDGGATWKLKLEAAEPATDLEMDPLDSQVLYAGLRHLGLRRSADGGETWEAIDAEPIPEATTESDWPELAIHHTPGMEKPLLYTVLGPCEHPHKKYTPISCFPRVYRSDDGGDTWELRYQEQNNVVNLSTYISYTHALTIHPENPDVVWYGGTRLFRSEDGGKEWKFIASNTHPDHHQLLPVPCLICQDGWFFLDLNDGGLAIGDGEWDWTSEAQMGLAVTQFQSLDATVGAEFLLGGTQDNGTLIYEGSDVWDHIDDGDAASTLIDRDDFETLYDVYVGSPPQRCNKVGYCPQSWPSIPGLVINGQVFGDLLPDTEADDDPNVSWYPPLVQSPTAPGLDHLLLFGTIDLFWSDDNGEEWHRVTPAPPAAPLAGSTPIAELGGAINPVTTIAASPAHTSWIYAGFYDGQLWHLDDVAHEWTLVDSGLPDRPVTSIVCHPEEEKTLYVSFAGFGEHSIYRSTNGGASWTPIDDSTGGEVAPASVNTLAIEPTAPYRLWAGTDYGVYLREGAPGQELWGKTAGLPNVAVYALRILEDGSQIYAATHGRGVWTRTTYPKVDIHLEDCCGYVDLYDPQPLVGISGYGFEPIESCTMSLFQGETLCASSAQDALGATLSTDGHGFLVAGREGLFEDRKAAWACFGGQCAGGVPWSRCQADRVEVRCGERAVVAAVQAAGDELDPPSTRLQLDPGAAGGAFTLTPALVRRGQAALALCEVQVATEPGEAQTQVLARAAEAINGDPVCRLAAVFAHVEDGKEEGPGEDELATLPRLVLQAPNRSGLALVGEVRPAAGAKAIVGGFRRSGGGTRVAPQLRLDGRAEGGALTLTERSQLGVCTQTVATRRGESAEEVAARLEQAFQGPETPPALPWERGCSAAQNPRDVIRRGASLYFGMGMEIELSNGDTGLAVTIGGGR